MNRLANAADSQTPLGAWLTWADRENGSARHREKSLKVCLKFPSFKFQSSKAPSFKVSSSKVAKF
jgi:hypothetical protein